MVRKLAEQGSRLVGDIGEQNMKQYLYPKNLKAKANVWLWGLKDLISLCVMALIAILLLVKLGMLLPAALTLCFAVLTIRKDEMTVLDFVKYAVRYFMTEQQEYKWR